MKIDLGDLARDRVTGFVGICFARTEYISGCTRIQLQPPVDKEGKEQPSGYFDEPMCEVIKRGVVPPDVSNRGGPRTPPPLHKAPKR